MNIKEIMQEVLASGSPDLHLQIGQSPMARVKTGNVATISKYPALTKEDMQGIISQISNEIQQKEFEENLETDFSFSLEGLGRFRVNVYHDRFGPAVALRVISDKIPTLQELGLGSAIEKLLQLPNGLVLVTGPTGSGKSTTLAAMIDYINEHRNAHIITIEDPIEYIYENKNCMVTQREVKIHTHSFANAMRSALRQDPDIVMVGEMRDLETISAAITLAETGHLVFSTLHTSDAVQTVDRIIDVFPSGQQAQIRSQAGSVLKAVISQTLIPHASGEGRIAARELMISNDAVRNCIAQGQTQQIYSMIEIGASDGMILMDDALLELVRNGQITKEDALTKANDIEMFTRKLEESKVAA